MLSARSPRYPALYDELSGVRFLMGKAEVTDAQARQLAERPYVDAIVIGEFDEDGRPVNELPAKKWRDRAQASPPPDDEPPSVPEPRTPKKPRSN